MVTRLCARPGCSEELALLARADAMYHSGACRVAAHRAHGVPSDLKWLPRWVRWSHRKIPLTVTGNVASSTDPATWSTYTAARRSSVGAGMGFVLNGDGIACLDLDRCLNKDGQLTTGAEALLSLAGDTYVEVSPSGRGLHVWGRASMPHGRVIVFQGQSVELYPSGRYMTVTHRPFRGSRSTLGDLTAVVDAVLGAADARPRASTQDGTFPHE